VRARCPHESPFRGVLWAVAGGVGYFAVWVSLDIASPLLTERFFGLLFGGSTCWRRSASRFQRDPRRALPLRGDEGLRGCPPRSGGFWFSSPTWFLFLTIPVLGFTEGCPPQGAPLYNTKVLSIGRPFFRRNRLQDSCFFAEIGCNLGSTSQK
jgi:hypothetical protein